ncbi:MAG: glucose-6-phosphate isomerase [Alphaproteobacteria bacterium]
MKNDKDMTQRSDLPAWKALERHYDDISRHHIKDLFAGDTSRFHDFHLRHENLLFDFSKNLITQDTLDKLFDLASVCELKNWRVRMFSGDVINTTENRAVLHTALRTRNPAPIMVDGQDIIPDIQNTLERMKTFSDEIREERRYTDIVNIGIGGSDLGSAMAYNALKPFTDRNIKLHFVSNVDSTHLSEVLSQVDPEKTLFIITSKTFTTQETMTNAISAREWMKKKLFKADISNHFVAVSQNTESAAEFGIKADHIFPIWDWVGGRFSLWSAIGLGLCIAIGFDNFRKMLDGAASMDEHFKTADMHKNLPVILALIGVWNRNFCNHEAISIVPYDEYLSFLPSYMQQLDMESNGKSVTRDNEHVKYHTGPIVIGGTGTNAQHAYFQMLHQGTTVIPCDFIAFAKSQNPLGDHQKKLLANVIAQAKALMDGREHKNPHKRFEGNKPSNMILADELTPYTLGMILALYEHKIFIQGVIWNVNSFDQCGVELGKVLANDIMQNPNNTATDADSSTAALLSFLRQKKNS